MSLRIKRYVCILLVIVMSAGTLPAFAAKKAGKTALDAIACEMDYGFSYKSKPVSKGLGTDALLFVGKTIAAKFIEKAYNWTLDDFVNSILGIETFNVEASLKEANGKLDGIKRLLDEMYQKLTAMDFRSTMQHRDQKYNELKPEVVSRINSLLSAKTKEDRQRIIRDWANRSMMGSSSGVTATTQWGNLISKPFGGYTFIQCYDGYAKASFPWEHDGYDFRDDARYADIVLYIESCLLTALYYNMVVEGEIEGKSAQTENENIEAFEQQITSVLEYFEDSQNKVVRNANRNRCQIAGATGFSIHLDKTYKCRVWGNDCSGMDINWLVKGFFVNNARNVYTPLQSARLKKLMEFYPGMSVKEILKDKAGVQGINDASRILLDEQYNVQYDGGFRSTATVYLKSIASSDRSFSSVGMSKLGMYLALTPVAKMVFKLWASIENTEYIVVCTSDSNDIPNSDDEQYQLGTIVESAKNSLSVKADYNGVIEFDITNSEIYGICEAGFEVEVLYHIDGSGNRVADRVWVNMPVTLSEEETLSGVVTKHEDEALFVKGDDGKNYEFRLGFNTRSLDAIKKGTRVTVTYQSGDDGKLYVLGKDKLGFTLPLFPFESLTMKKGATKKLKGLTSVPGTWIVEDETVAKLVKEQKLKAVAAGQTNLVFVVGNLKKSVSYMGESVSPGDSIVIPVTVVDKNAAIKSLTIKPKKCKLNVGESLQLEVTWKPKTATETTLAFESSETSVATVDGAGIVTGVATGKATITVTAPSGVKKSRVVNVE